MMYKQHIKNVSVSK